MMRAELRITDLSGLRSLAQRLAAVVQAGDVIILTGDLGAGKTTFTAFLGAAMGVQGRVTSPTFVIAREHAPAQSGPGLIHVDAYRVGDDAEFDDLDLGAQREDCVTVIEWGRGLAEQLAPERLEITLLRQFEDPEHAGELAPSALADASALQTENDGADSAEDYVGDGAEDDGDEEPRRILLDATGPSWEARLAALAARSSDGAAPAAGSAASASPAPHETAPYEPARPEPAPAPIRASEEHT